MENPVFGKELASSPVLRENLERAKIRRDNFEELATAAWDILEEFGSKKQIDRNGKSIEAMQFSLEFEDGWSLTISKSDASEDSSVTWLEILPKGMEDQPGFTLAEINFDNRILLDADGNELSTESTRDLVFQLLKMRAIADSLYNV